MPSQYIAPPILWPPDSMEMFTIEQSLFEENATMRLQSGPGVAHPVAFKSL